MRKSLLLIVLLMMSGVWVTAQSTSSSTSDSVSSGKTSDLDTLTGCLKFTHDNYFLTEDDGAEHQLAGSERKLGHEIGKEIEVTGKPGTVSVDHTLAGGSSTVVEQKVFKVRAVKPVADQCKFAGQ